MATNHSLKEPRSVIVKTFVADKEPTKVLDFFLNMKNWEYGGVQKNTSRAEGIGGIQNHPLGKRKLD
jgi:hypothetical protein